MPRSIPYTAMSPHAHVTLSADPTHYSSTTLSARKQLPASAGDYLLRPVNVNDILVPLGHTVPPQSLGQWRGNTPTKGATSEVSALRSVGFFNWNSQSYLDRWIRRSGMAAVGVTCGRRLISPAARFPRGFSTVCCGESRATAWIFLARNISNMC